MGRGGQPGSDHLGDSPSSPLHPAPAPPRNRSSRTWKGMTRMRCSRLCGRKSGGGGGVADLGCSEILETQGKGLTRQAGVRGDVGGTETEGRRGAALVTTPAWSFGEQGQGVRRCSPTISRMVTGWSQGRRLAAARDVDPDHAERDFGSCGEILER